MKFKLLFTLQFLIVSYISTCDFSVMQYDDQMIVTFNAGRTITGQDILLIREKNRVTVAFKGFKNRENCLLKATLDAVETELQVTCNKSLLPDSTDTAEWIDINGELTNKENDNWVRRSIFVAVNLAKLSYAYRDTRLFISMPVADKERSRKMPFFINKPFQLPSISKGQ